MKKTKTVRVNEMRIAMIASDMGIDKGSLLGFLLDLFDSICTDGGARCWLQRAYEDSDGELCIEGRLHQMTPEEWDDMPEGHTHIMGYEDPELDALKGKNND